MRWLQRCSSSMVTLMPRRRWKSSRAFFALAHGLRLVRGLRVLRERELAPRLRPGRTVLRFEVALAVFERADSPSRCGARVSGSGRSEEHTSELQSLMSISYAVFCL